MQEEGENPGSGIGGNDAAVFELGVSLAKGNTGQTEGGFAKCK